MCEDRATKRVLEAIENLENSIMDAELLLTVLESSADNEKLRQLTTSLKERIEEAKRSLLED